MTYQILPCPNCNGAGCPTCQNTGKVRVEEAELQKLKQMVGQLSQAAPAPRSPERIYPERNRRSRRGEVGPAPSVTNLAGIIAFSILSLIAGAAAASWYFLKTLKPFFSGLITLITLAATRFAWRQPFFQPQEPDDFLKAIKNKE